MPTILTPFRLTTADLAQLDAVAAALASRTGRPHTRADAIRWAIQLAAERVSASHDRANGSARKKNLRKSRQKA
jgi:hypothetical protein